MSQKLRIQTALVNLVKDYEFPSVIYNANGVPSQSVSVTPLTPILCNEIQSNFANDDEYGQGVKSVRLTWPFAVRIKFNREVLLEPFEEEMCNNPPRIGPDTVNGYPYVQLRLEQTTPVHPVQRQPSTGTEVEFIFQASQGRR
jgi:hypothetical protein